MSSESSVRFSFLVCVACILLGGILLAPPVAAQLGVVGLDIEGTMTFPANTDIDLLQDEMCVAPGGWSGIDPAIVDEEKLLDAQLRGFISGECDGTDSHAESCVDPPFDAIPGGNPIPILIGVCDDADNTDDGIEPTSTYTLTGSNWFDQAPCNLVRGERGDDLYNYNFLESEPLSSKVLTCTNANVSCLLDQDREECYGALVIEYAVDNAGTLETSCPGSSGYPDEGRILAYVPSYRGGSTHQSLTDVRAGRQTRFAVTAGNCNELGGCAGAPNGCEIPLECRLGAPCDFAGSILPGCTAGATTQPARVDVFVRQGEDIFSDLVKFERRLTNVPIVCNAVTRIRIETTFPGDGNGGGTGTGGGGGPITSRFQVLGYEDDILYCDDDFVRTPFVALDDGPANNERHALVEDNPVASCASTAPVTPVHEVNEFTFQAIPLSDQPTISDDDQNYAGWSSFVLRSPDLRDVMVHRSSPIKGRAPDFESPVPADASLWRNSTAYGLFSSCAGAPPAGLEHIRPADADGDWIEVTGSHELRRCPTLASGMCSDVDLPLNEYPCAGVPVGDPSSVAMDPFVMAPGEVDGCLILEDLGLPNTLEALRFDPTTVVGCGQHGRAPILNLSRVETVGDLLDEEDPDGFCGPLAGDDCFNGTTAFRAFPPSFRGTRLRAQVFSRFAEETAPPSSCDLSLPFPLTETRYLHYRMVPGDTGNLGGPYRMRRYRLNFEGPDVCPDDRLSGNLMVNHFFGGDSKGNGLTLEVPPQPVPGTRAPLPLSDALCFGKARVFLNSNAPLSTGPGDVPLMFGRKDDPSCDEHDVTFGNVYTGRGDTFFRGRVLSDPTTAVVVMPLPEGEYVFKPSVQRADTSGRTVFPEEGPHEIVCGETSIICLEDLVPDPRCTFNSINYPFGSDLDDDCDLDVEITLDLFDCDQGVEAVYDVTVRSDDVEELSGATVVDLGFAQPLEDRANPGTFWDGRTLTVDQECGPAPVTFRLPLGDGPSTSHGTTTYTFDFVDPDGNTTQCVVRVNSDDITPPEILCPDPVVECLEDPTRTLSGFCEQGRSDNCDQDPMPVTYTGTMATTFAGSGSCADETYNVGRTDVEFRVTDDFGNPGTCDVTVRLPSEPVADLAGPDSVCRDRVGTDLVLALDATGTLPDKDPDNLPDVLTYRWSLEPGCPAGATITPDAVDQRLASLSIPGIDAGMSCLPVETCEVKVEVEELVPGAAPCTSEATHLVTINPAPYANPNGPYEQCSDPNQPGPVRQYPLSSAGSLSCVGGGLTYQWVLSGPDCNVTLSSATAANPIVSVDDSDLPVMCDVELTVRNTAGCEDTQTTTFFVGADPIADAGGPYFSCMADVPATTTSVVLDGSTYSSPTPPDPTCGLSYLWEVTGCVGALSSTTDPNPVLTLENDPDGDGVREPILCDIKLTVTDCNGCMSMDTTTLDLCPGPEALFDTTLQNVRTNQCGSVTPIDVLFENRGTSGGCASIDREEWVFGAPGDATPPVVSAPPAPLGQDWLVSYATGGLKTPSLMVFETIGTDRNGNDVVCTDDYAPCGLCVPECVEVSETQGSGNAEIRWDVRCQDDDRICVDSEDVEIEIEIHGIDQCGSNCTLSPTSNFELEIGGCDPTNPATVTIPAQSLTQDPGNPGRFLASLNGGCLAPQLSSIGCECGDRPSTVRYRFQAQLQCGGPSACNFDFDIDDDLVPAANHHDPFWIHCTGGSCLPIPATTTLGCGCP